MKTISLIVLTVLHACLFAQDLEFVGHLGNVPNCFLDENGNNTGIDVDILNELSNRSKYNISLKLVPWARVLISIKNGMADGGFPLFKTSEREEYAIYTTVPLHIVTMVAYVRRDSKLIYKDISSLYGIEIGTIRGFSISAEFDQAVKDGKIRIIELNNSEQLIKLVEMGRLEIIVGTSANIGYNMKQLNIELSQLAILNDSGKTFLALSKNANIENLEKIILDINTTLKEMNDDGTINKITQKYLTDIPLLNSTKIK